MEAVSVSYKEISEDIWTVESMRRNTMEEREIRRGDIYYADLSPVE